MENSIAIREKQETGLASADQKQFSTAIAVTPEYIAQTKQSLALLRNMVQEVLVEGIDYGSVPGVPEEFLWDPGASQIVAAFNARFGEPRKVRETATDDLIAVVVNVPIISFQTGQEVAICAGAASTMEVKHKYRNVKREELIDWGYTEETAGKGKKDKWGNWKYRIPNPEPGELLNTIWKIACKRGRVGAAQLLPGVSSALREKFAGSKATKKKEPTSDWDIFWSDMTKRGLKQEEIHKMLKVKSMKDYVASGKTLEQAVKEIDNLLALEEDAGESDATFEKLESAGTGPVIQAQRQPDQQVSGSKTGPEPAHFCDTHATAFFMRGKMKGFAHPILDENEKETGKWCWESPNK
jgi:hypothetical protein